MQVHFLFKYAVDYMNEASIAADIVLVPSGMLLACKLDKAFAEL